MAPYSPDATQLSDLPDAVLCERASSGDVAAFQSLIRRYAPMMRAYAIRLTGSHSDADDVLQETFIQAWKKIDTVLEPAKVKSWLMTLTSNKSIDLIRSRKPTYDLDSARDSQSRGSNPEDNAITSSQMGELNKLLQKLPQDQRQIWVMREMGGSSYKEIAEALDVPEATVRGRLARARVTLTKGMEGWN